LGTTTAPCSPTRDGRRWTQAVPVPEVDLDRIGVPVLEFLAGGGGAVGSGGPGVGLLVGR
jgi:hypothetical protein